MGASPDDDLAQRIADAVMRRMAEGPTLAQIDAKIRELDAKLARVIDAAAPVPSKLTWGELWKIYADAEASKLDSWKSRRSEGGHLVAILGETLVSETTSATIRHYRARRNTEVTKRKKPPAPKTINNEIVLLLLLLRWACRQRPPLLPVDPLAAINRDDVLDPIQNLRYNVVEDDEEAPLSLATFLQHGDEFDRALVLTAHSSGMRRGELARLDHAWIDRRPGPDGKPLRLVEIPPGISKGRRGKKRGRLTIISEEALAAIDEYRRTLPLPLQRRGGPVFMNPETAVAYVPDTLTTRFTRLQERAGAAGLSGPVWLHDLRRSFITLALRRGEDAKNVMDLAGHSTFESQERYRVRSIREAVLLRDRIEAARAEDLAALARERAGPHRAPVDNYGNEKNNP